MGQVKVDEYLREQIEYREASFPFGIWLDDFQHLLSHTLDCHWHESMEFGVVLEGEVEYYVNQTHIPLKKGDIIFLNGNTLHMARQTGSQAKMAAFNFHQSLFSQEIIYQKYFKPFQEMQVQGFRIDRGTPLGERIGRRLEELYYLEEKEGYELHVLSLLGELWLDTLAYLKEQEHKVITGSRINRVQEETVKRMLSYIHESYGENITIEALAEYGHVSRSECFRCFKRFTGKTPMEYVNEYRLIQGAAMLRRTNLTIAQISNASGFSTSSYFGKVFREKYGMTPLKYRG